MGKVLATREAYGEELKALGGENSNIVVLDADLSKSTKTNEFAKMYPDRFVNCGIAEQNMMGVAAGLAAAGKLPFVSTFAMFASGRAFEQVRNSICYPGLNVKIAATHAGITVGEDGASHQTVEDIALMRVLPGMTVIVPADAAETRQAVRAAAAVKGPVYLRLGRMAASDVFDEKYQFTLGKAAQLADGKDVTLIACGMLTSAAVEAAKLLAAEGVSVRVLNMATIKPLDTAAIVAAARDTGAIVSCEEHSVLGGLGGAVAEVLGEQCPVPLERVGIQDRFGESGTPQDLLKKFGLTAADIVGATRRVLARKSS
ncbi:MAG TPA: transketolase family protein [Patescibacteria group bacterium]|nr:transketolase family protein [Patescibacteria group bacterium]